MQVRLGIICTADSGFWERYMPQDETLIYEVLVEIPDLPPGWSVSRVMVCEPTDEMVDIV